MKAGTLLPTLLLLLASLPARAQFDLHILNHLAIGIEAGTAGVGIDASVPVTSFVDIQGGFTMMPRFSFNTSLETTQPSPELADEIRMKGKPLMKGGKVLVNVMPLPMLTSFHVTAGAYFGSDEVLGLTNRDPLPDMAAYNALHPDDKSMALVGSYLLEPDAEGSIDARFRVKPVKAYVGIGIGRGVPKRRIGFKFDVGCLIWGKPTLWQDGAVCPMSDSDEEGGGFMKLATKLRVYPMLNLRLSGRIF